MNAIKARWREIAAFMAAAIIIAIGVHLAITDKEVWLNRAGALVIIVGVMLATSRINELLAAKVVTFTDGNFDLVFAETLASLEQELDEKLPTKRRDDLKASIHKEMVSKMGSLLEERKRLFKLYEVGLVVVGTFLNGFGDWLVCLFKCCHL